ncbi:MAG: hypothetical protein P8Z40_07580 [Chloroflexota bacterium]|jgi:hypothetical protein
MKAVSALQKKLLDEFKVYALVVLSILAVLMVLSLIVPGFPVSIRPGTLLQIVVGSATGMAFMMWWYPSGLGRDE